MYRHNLFVDFLRSYGDYPTPPTAQDTQDQINAPQHSTAKAK